MALWKEVILLFALLCLSSGCRVNGETSAETAVSSPSLTLVRHMAITTDAEGGSARPEVVATADRVFVAYLGHIGDMSGRTFDVKVYDKDLVTRISSTTIVPPSVDYGTATDIRVAGDSQYVFTFFETATTTTTYLHGAKYALNDTFDRVAGTSTPIASGKPVFQLMEGEEILNDPAQLIGPDSVFVITRIWSSISTSYARCRSARDNLTVAQTARYIIFNQEFQQEMRGMLDGARGGRTGKNPDGRGPGQGMASAKPEFQRTQAFFLFLGFFYIVVRPTLFCINSLSS